MGVFDRLPINVQPDDISGLQHWLRADSGMSFSVTGTISAWADRSGRAFNGSGSGSVGPVFSGSGGPNNHPYVSFNNSAFTFSNPYNSMTSGEVFLVFNRVVHNISNDGLWDVGSSTSETRAPFPNDGAIYDDWGTTVRKNAGALLPTHVVGQWYVYNVYSAPSDWGNFMNGRPYMTTTTSTVGFLTTPKLGASGPSNTVTNFVGGIAEYVVYNRKLSNAERNKLMEYFFFRYGIQPG